MKRRLLPLAIVALLLTTAKGDPEGLRLELRWHPRIPMARGGSVEVALVAEIVGGMIEEWYCPRVEWTFTDDTRASEESDCTPWDRATEIPRRWTKHKMLGPGQHRIRVELSRHGHSVASQTAQFEVL